MSAASIVRFWCVIDDELRAVGVAAEQLDEAADVRVVERSLDLVEEVERARPREEEREQERDRAERLLAAREQREPRDPLARRPELDLDAGLAPPRPRARQAQPALAAGEERRGDLVEVALDGGVGLAKRRSTVSVSSSRSFSSSARLASRSARCSRARRGAPSRASYSSFASGFTWPSASRRRSSRSTRSASSSRSSPSAALVGARCSSRRRASSASASSRASSTSIRATRSRCLVGALPQLDLRARIEAEADEARRRLEQRAPTSAAEGDDRDELAERAERLERRRESLGQVNPLAKEEYDGEKARLDELATQREGPRASLVELEKLRAELDGDRRAPLQRDLRRGAAQLHRGRRRRSSRAARGACGSTEPRTRRSSRASRSSCGRRARRCTRLSLLSGGEKALGAISFLFALFLARPCPFYLLDEVEAALDDTNIGRFVELLRRYADRAQFVVITHQKRTMEAADMLYGVTMGGDGVSQIVSRRLPREEAERRSAA